MKLTELKFMKLNNKNTIGLNKSDPFLSVKLKDVAKPTRSMPWA